MSALLAILLAAADADLAAAEQAWAQGDYEHVLPRLQKALAHPLPRAELARAYALEGHVQVAFDRAEPATLAFRRLLGVDDHFLLEPEASPKLLAVFAEARRQGPLLPPASAVIEPVKPLQIPLELPPPVPAQQVEQKRSLWWLWTGVAVLATGAAVGAGVWYAERPIVPAGTLGTGQLK
jgi:hypothetical protein